MKIYSGEVFMGNCGDPTNLYDNHCDWEELEGNDNFKAIPNLYVGDQVVVIHLGKSLEVDYVSGICVVVDKNIASENTSPFIMGLSSIDFTTENKERDEWYISKVKSWKDCIEGERVPSCAQITYKLD